jgi:hypothetical protein
VDDDPLTSPRYTIGRDGYVPPADDIFSPRPAQGDPYVGDGRWQVPAVVPPSPASSPASSPAVAPSAPAPASRWNGGEARELHLPVTEVMPVVGRQPQRPAF